MKLSDYVFDFVAAQGVNHVFMLPGGGAMHLVDSLGHNPDLGFVCCLHEQACAIAAEAYARVTNNLGVALVTTGPGGTNAVTGVAAAWLDSTPCLFISGQVKRADLMDGLGVRQLGVQELDIVRIVQSITKYAITVKDPSAIRFHLEKAVYLARSGRPGPVWIDVPLDIQAAAVEPRELNAYEPEAVPGLDTRTELAAKVEEAVESLKAAKRPVILAGNGVRLANAQADFRRLVDRLGIPVLTTRLGVDLIPADHELSVGMPGSFAPRGANFTLQNSDWLLILGARLDMALIAYAPQKLARAAKKIMVNIDPAEIRKVGSIIDVPVCADVGSFIREFDSESEDIETSDWKAWLFRCRGWKTEYPFVLPEHRAITPTVSVYAFAEALSDALGPSSVVLPGNAGNACEIFLTAFKVKDGQRVFHNKGTGAMGFCQPASVGACLGSGRKPTICVDGDGGFQLNIQELETVHRLDLPVKYFIMNNQGYASIRSSEKGYFGRLTGADRSSGLTLPDVLKVASAYGVATARIADPKDLRHQIARVLEVPGPVICDVSVVPDEIRAPRVASVQRPDGSLASRPLEDMSPLLPRDEFLSNMIVPPLPDD